MGRSGLSEEQPAVGTERPARRSRRRRGQAARAEASPNPSKEILVSFEDFDPVVAVVENGRLVELDLDPPSSRRLVGNIYKGKVQNVLPGMQAAFVDIGLERNAFLFVADARPLLPGGAVPARSAIQDVVRVGEEILVQIAKEPSGSKGARITRHVSIPGRYLVLVPGADHVGISRRVGDDAERSRLRAIAEGLRGDGPFGLIVRTAAAERTAEELQGDWEQLLATWRAIEDDAQRAKAPAILYQELDVVQRMARDLLNGDVQRIVVDRRDGLLRVAEVVRRVAPHYAERLELVVPTNGESLFAARGIEAQSERALARKVPLPNGGSLVIDQTEALTVIDVNTGHFVGQNSVDETFLQTNLEATEEIARQIRLRDIGGIIVIDFIDMDVPAHRKQLLAALEQACRPDHSKPEILGLTALGLVEMTRKKARQGLREMLTKPCPTCEGCGRIAAEGVLAHRARQLIRSALRHSDAEAVLVEVHPDVAALLIGGSGAAVRQMEEETGRSIFIRGSSECRSDEVRIRSQGDRTAVEAESRPVREGQRLELRVERAHASGHGHGIAKLDGYVIDIGGGAAHVGEVVMVEVIRAFRTYAKAKMV